jgi:hypothetical protein
MSELAASPVPLDKPHKHFVTAAEFDNYEVVLCSHGLPCAYKMVDCATGKIVSMEATSGSWFELRPKPKRQGIVI